MAAEDSFNYSNRTEQGFNMTDKNSSTSKPLDASIALLILTQGHSGIKPLDPVEIVLIITFTILITFGVIGNGLVCFVVFRNPQMRTPRNIFIINLAISDLILCLFTQPLNLYRLLNTKWFLGAFMCKLSGMLQGTNVFVSTISITAIALDRFQIIVYPTKDSMKKIGGAAALLTIWIISFLMSSPLLIFSVYETNKPYPSLEFYMYYCIEDVSLKAEKGAYSVASMMVQYILPIIIVSVAHARICNKLKYRMVNRPQRNGDRAQFSCRNESRSRRKRRTNMLLSMIAVVFALSWMPLNIFNILYEFKFEIFRVGAVNVTLVYVICHMLVLCSACINPVLYGWLNDNFRTEFTKVFRCTCCRRDENGTCRLCCGQDNDDNMATNTVPVIVFTKDENGHMKSMNMVDRRMTNTSQMLVTTDIDLSRQSIVSL